MRLFFFFLASCLLSCNMSEDSTIEFFDPDGQFLDVTFNDGQSYFLEVVPLALNTTQFFYNSEQLTANGFVNRRSLDGVVGGNLNFNPLLSEDYFDDAGIFIPAALDLPLSIPFSKFQLNISGPDSIQSLFFSSVDVTLESWEGDIVTGRFEQDPLLANIEPLIIDRGSFRVFIQAIKF